MCALVVLQTQIRIPDLDYMLPTSLIPKILSL